MMNLSLVSKTTPVDNGPFVVGNYYVRPVTDTVIFGLHLPYIHFHKGDISSEFHYHLDARFIPDAVYKRLNRRPNMIFGAASVSPWIPQSGEPMLGRVECVREFIPPLELIYSETQRGAFALVERKCKGKTCQGMVCPHQGTDLSSVEPILVDGQLVRVCPSHGLQWNVATGTMVPRSKPLTLVKRHEAV